MRSLVEQGQYDQDDFCTRLDRDLFPLLNGEPANGPGGYTSQSIREAWRRRVEQGLCVVKELVDVFAGKTVVKSNDPNGLIIEIILPAGD